MIRSCAWYNPLPVSEWQQNRWTIVALWKRVAEKVGLATKPEPRRFGRRIHRYSDSVPELCELT